MTEEEKLVRENAQIIRYCALDFMRERHMPYTLYYDDVFQEAAIGFISNSDHEYYANAPNLV